MASLREVLSRAMGTMNHRRFPLTRKDTKRATAAFSLIELMAVLAVIAIMSALIIPEMRGTLDDALLRSSARQLIHACELANSRAIALNEPQRLRLEPSSGRYFIETLPDPASPSPPASAGRARAPVEGVIDSRITLTLARSRADAPDAAPDEPAERASPRPDDAEELANDPNALSFQPDGTASGPEVLLQDRAGFRLALRVQPVTARMRLIALPRQ